MYSNYLTFQKFQEDRAIQGICRYPSTTRRVAKDIFDLWKYDKCAVRSREARDSKEASSKNGRRLRISPRRDRRRSRATRYRRSWNACQRTARRKRCCCKRGRWESRLWNPQARTQVGPEQDRLWRVKKGFYVCTLPHLWVEYNLSILALLLAYDDYYYCCRLEIANVHTDSFPS